MIQNNHGQSPLKSSVVSGRCDNREIILAPIAGNALIVPTGQVIE